ncbi:MAG: IS4 family transposase [Ferruginibacter sp.]
MNQGRMAFTQIMDFASQDIFKVCVKRYNGNHKTKEFTCWKQFLCLAFGQLTHRESMSDTMLCLKLNADKLYHLGIGKVVNKSTLSRANEKRDWRIFQDFGIKLIEQARIMYEGDNQLNVKLKGRVFALDSSTVDLCLEVFLWAPFRSTKAAIKIHTLLDLKTSITEFIFISEGNVHDVNVMDLIPIQKGSYYVMDKAYVDFARLYNIKQDKAYFVVRAKENMQFKRMSSRAVDKSLGILCDQDIMLTGINSSNRYPEHLRRIKFYDSEFNRTFVFLTNNFKLNAETVSRLYKHRWGIELFFKWIKQNLKVQSFWGFSENAVKTQIWVAISVYVLVAIAKKKLKLTHSPYEIIQYISLAPFEKRSISETFLNNENQDVKEQNSIQLKLI